MYHWRQASHTWPRSMCSFTDVQLVTLPSYSVKSPRVAAVTKVRRSWLLNAPGMKNCASGVSSGHHNSSKVIMLSLITLDWNLCLWMGLLGLPPPKDCYELMELSRDFTGEIPKEIYSSNIVNEIIPLCCTSFIQHTQTVGRDLVEVKAHRPVFNCMIFLCVGNTIVWGHTWQLLFF